MLDDNKREFYNSLRAKVAAFKEVMDKDAPDEDDEEELIEAVVDFVGEAVVDGLESLDRIATATEAQFD
jgi:flagellar motor component MotA